MIMIIEDMSYLDYRKALNTAVLDYPRAFEFLSFSQSVLYSASSSENVSEEEFYKLVKLVNILLLTYGI